MLGFATVDYAAQQNTLTVWLTSATGRVITHSNAVTFQLDDPQFDRLRPEQMAAHRFVVLTDRTSADADVLASWVGFAPCDLRLLASETQAALNLIRSKAPSEAGDVTLPQVPAAPDQAAMSTARPAELTLAVADYARALWTTWLGTEAERVRRRKSLPAGHDGDVLADLPIAFTESYRPHPVRVWA